MKKRFGLIAALLAVTALVGCAKAPTEEEYKAWEKILHKFESMQHFMNEMVEKYSEFEQGKITNISLGNIESEQEAI